MQAKMEVHGDVTVVSLIGKLEIQNTQKMKKAFIDSLSHKKVVFSLDQLSFVGSSGIQNFFNILEEFQKQNIMDLKITGLKSDFLRLLHHSKKNIENCENLEKAMARFREE